MNYKKFLMYVCKANHSVAAFSYLFEEKDKPGRFHLEKAKDFGYDNCYIETLPYMEAAVKLYKRNGFVNLDKPMGNTSHFNCDVWMLKEIN